MTISLMRWALWSCDCQSDVLGFVVVWFSVNSRPSLSILVDSIYAQPLNKAGFYREEASFQGNAVHISMSACMNYLCSPYYPRA